MNLLTGLVLVAFLPSLSALGEEGRPPRGPNECLSCHAAKVPPAAYYASVHQKMSCLSCHIEKAGAPAGRKGCVTTFERVDCSSCHAQIATEHEKSAHNSQRLPIRCDQCHSDIHALKPQKGDKLATAALCGKCHEDQQPYFESSHHRALREGRADAATCTDCHGTHTVAKIDRRPEGRTFHTAACLKCHANEKLMAKNEVATVVAATYFESYHGKNVRLGYPGKVAGCADCHGSHTIQKVKDPASSVHPRNRAQTCQQCHAGASASFGEFIAHADHRDEKKHPALFWTFVAMNSLLAGTFLFFWVHSVLWAIRSFIENRRKARAASFPGLFKRGGPAAHAPIPEGKKLYRRFRSVHIFLHLVMAVSFLALALTGLPLKFADTSWGKTLMDLLGGTQNAGRIHRISAVVTFLYFGAAVGMSIHFLFFDKKQKGSVLARLFGPDSLFPNLRDLHDIRDMFRWFFFRGPKPTFERWTYWEKFDFLAVFWGMLAIGLSGLMLWFPTFFARFLPGWAFNLATIIHSDEALLATGFIFTVHFFNTHFRPEKFPMDFVIFNGEISKEEMIEERGDQWRRYEATGTTEQFAVQKPSSLLWDFAFKTFGFAAVLIGLGLAVAVVYTLVSRG